jgi:hypothetical protein
MLKSARQVSWLLPLAFLASCSTTVPLPVWQPLNAGAMPAPINQTAPVVQPPIAAASPVIAGTLSSPLPLAAVSQDSPGVAARFPAPARQYATPGLQANRSQWTTQSEMHNWLSDQASASLLNPGLQTALLNLGQSQRGTPIEALVLARTTDISPAGLAAQGKPTVLLVGQQHGNEPAGSEALLVIARELAQGSLNGLLEQINVVIVPRANPDGAERDQRATSNGIDMNRDHLLLNTPEAQALARLSRDYKPAAVVDAHEYTVAGRYLEKFGAVQKYDALLQYATTANLPEFVTKAAEEWYRLPMLADLQRAGLSNQWYYTTSNNLADKKVAMGGVQPDTGRNVNGLKNAVSFLVETRGIGLDRQHIQRRVHTQFVAISSTLTSTARRATDLNILRNYVDKDISQMACQNQAIISAQASPSTRELILLDPISGADKVLNLEWDNALQLQTTKSRTRPCGYVLSAASSTAVSRLRMQGVKVLRVADPAVMLGERYQQTQSTSGQRQDVRGAIADANPITQVEVTLSPGLIDVARGSYYVPLNQPLANLVIAALEPDSQSSFFANQLLPQLQSTIRVTAVPQANLEELN